MTFSPFLVKEAKNQVKPWLLLFYNFITDFLSFELDKNLKILWCSVLNYFYQKSMKLLVKIAKKLPPPVGFEPTQSCLVA